MVAVTHYEKIRQRKDVFFREFSVMFGSAQFSRHYVVAPTTL